MWSALVLSVLLGVALGDMPSHRWNPPEGWAPRIINGVDAPDKYPYIVSIRRGSNGRHTCGGSWLATKYVLTAAHCCFVEDGDLSVTAGILTQDQTDGQSVKVAKVNVHPDYDVENNWANDICVLTLANSLTANEKVKQVTLPPQDFAVKQGDKVTIVGWGLTHDEDTEVPNHLQLGENFVAWSLENCELAAGFNLEQGHLCAVGAREDQGVCRGDSGSPLTAQGTQTQLGVASWVFLPCGSGQPDFYARVPHFTDWIKETVGADAVHLKIAAPEMHQ